jgi:DNA helicase-2/ATP-dependent DNA helicase PcrA
MCQHHYETVQARGETWTGAIRYEAILVDEFQDINPLDLALITVLGKLNRAPITIVGDDDQAIYEWRGATPEFILEPEQYLQTKVVTQIFTSNYRSPRNIVEMSQRLIRHNERRVRKSVNPVRVDDAKVEVRKFAGVSEAIENITGLVRSLLDEADIRNIALVGRKRSQIVPYQIVFAGQGIPFCAAEDLQVFLSDAFNELKDILAICGRARGGRQTWLTPVEAILKLCDKVTRYPLSKAHRKALGEYLYSCRIENLLEGITALCGYRGPLKRGNEDGRRSLEFAAAIAELLKAETVSEALRAVSDHFEGWRKDYGKALEDIFYTDPPFLYLADLAERYGSDFEAFLRDVDRAVATLARVPSEDEEVDWWKERLHLMTALRAKGREFDVVVVLDANDGIWPSKLAETKEDLEQERRLFYVAVTRPRQYLCFAVNERILGHPARPTPYLIEMGLNVD